jgi:hypothetical protein
VSSFFPTTPVGLTLPPGLQCVTGVVSLFRFIVAPQPGSVIGTITTTDGRRINLIQTQPTPLGGTSLASVEGRTSTVCGVFVTTTGGQTALDVRVVNPGAPSPTGTPMNIDLRTLLALLLVLLLLGGAQGLSNLGTLLAQQTNLTSLLSQPQVQSLLSQPVVQNLLNQPDVVRQLTGQLQSLGIRV